MLGPGDPRGRRSLIYSAHISDFQLADEESPARVEFLDPFGGEVSTSAHRPQEALVPQQIEFTVRQLNRFRRERREAGQRRARGDGERGPDR